MGVRYLLMIILLIGPMFLSFGASARQGKSEAKTRLVMVEIDHWKVVFFNLPKELPLLLKPGKNFNARARRYDFTEGLPAMKVFLSLRPKDKYAPAFRRFIKKWPVYQEFFKAVDEENYKSARKLVSEILKIDPQEPGAHFYLGSLNTQAGDFAKAEKNYRACIKGYPEYGPAYVNLARLAKARDALPEARHLLEEAIRCFKLKQREDDRKIAEKMLESLKSPALKGGGF